MSSSTSGPAPFVFVTTIALRHTSSVAPLKIYSEKPLTHFTRTLWFWTCRSCKMSFATCCREHRQWTVQYITAVSSSQLQRARELKGSLISSLREKVDVCFDKFRQLGVALLYIALDKSLKMEAAETARMKKSLHDRDGTCSRFSKVEDDSAWFESSFKLE